MIPDERLGLVFACCHPALALEAQVPLTLRLVGGLTVPEIARALLLPEATVAQRLVRAKRKVRALGHPAREPPPTALPAACGAVLAVLYLVFNEGYAATAGDALVARRPRRRGDPARAASSATLLPDEPEPAGLLALMLLHHSRRARAHRRRTASSCCSRSRTAARWDGAAIDEALPLVDRALDAAPARRARTRCRPRSPRCTPAPRTPRRPTGGRSPLLYDELARVLPSPVVALNRAVAVAMADGPAAGLALIDTLATAARSTTTTCCTPRAPTSSGARAGAPTPRPRYRARARAGDERSRSARFLARRLRGVRPERLTTTT